MRKLVLILVAPLLLAGCSGGKKAPEPTFYLLRAEARIPDGPQQPPVNVGINRVSLADYLGQAGVVVAINSDQVRPARQHLWAEPLDSSVRLFLRDAISADLGYPVSADLGRRQSWQYRVDIRIDEWRGSLAGDARIVASWLVIDVATDSELSRYRFEQTGTLAADGYDALVAAQTRLLDALAATIADSLREINTETG
ncbi:MAG: membrane integrity-associated transporter subunit PqiC [Chromatiales bacterium]|nr:MAG: membrane integrity-associated transporter subunit PqiC [Chromatiales bacterium]